MRPGIPLASVALFATVWAVSAQEPTCRPCPGEPCTRPCLAALQTGGPAALRPYSGGTCPALAPGSVSDFGRDRRSFLLYVPKSTRGPFGVVFFWAAGGKAEATAPIVSMGYDADGYILVLPEGKVGPGGQAAFPLSWSMDPKGADDDLRFFDDVVTCLDQRFPIDRRRIHSAGYSVGGCFSAYLMSYRSEYLASFVSYSGSDKTPSGERLIPMPPRPVPGLLYHGGDTDSLWAGKAATLSLAGRMSANGQFTVVCDHGRGHVIGDTVQNMWAFMLAHPFSPGNSSVWAASGIVGKLPAHCQVVR